MTNGGKRITQPGNKSFIVRGRLLLPVNRDFKIRDATASRTRWLIMDWDKNAVVCAGKSKVKIPVTKQDDAAAKRSLSV